MERGEDEMTYGSVPMAPVIFQDDVLHAAGGIKEARNANARMSRVVKRLNLTLNRDKTFCISMGSKKQINKIKAELEKNPLMCGNIETELKESFKWLGQILSSGGLAESVNATVQSREGKIRGACLEIAQIVNDLRSHVVGGIETNGIYPGLLSVGRYPVLSSHSPMNAMCWPGSRNF